MKFVHEGTEFWIEFSYENNRVRRSRAVTCRIFEPKDRDVKDSYFKRGWSVCAPSDQFRKETGRKVALTRALKDCHKDFRKLVWTAYLGRKGGAR